ncbi:hypothetical protein D3C76_1367670 [compost metagenome]
MFQQEKPAYSIYKDDVDNGHSKTDSSVMLLVHQTLNQSLHFLSARPFQMQVDIAHHLSSKLKATGADGQPINPTI